MKIGLRVLFGAAALICLIGLIGSLIPFRPANVLLTGGLACLFGGLAGRVELLNAYDRIKNNDPAKLSVQLGGVLLFLFGVLVVIG